MQMVTENRDIYQERIKKLEDAKMKIDEIKNKIYSLEKELLEIKQLDRLYYIQNSISNKKTIYKKDDIVFVDNLIYQRFPLDRLFTWQEAVEYSKGLTLSNYSNWRLPTLDELERLLSKRSYNSLQGGSYYTIKEFLDVMPQIASFWTSTEENELYAWVVDFNQGYDYWRRKTLKYHALFVKDIVTN